LVVKTRLGLVRHPIIIIIPLSLVTNIDNYSL
jgi:hypothetical protein